MCKIIPQKCVLYQTILFKVIHNERSTSKGYTVRVLHTYIHTAVFLLSFYWSIFNTHHYWGSGKCFPIVFLRYTNMSGSGFRNSNIIFKNTKNKCSFNYFRGCIFSVILNYIRMKRLFLFHGGMEKKNLITLLYETAFIQKCD